jgi:hypothetical protein
LSSAWPIGSRSRVRMAAHFDLTRFRNPPPQLAAILTSSTPQEDEMSDSHMTRPRKPDPDHQGATAPASVSEADANAEGDDASSGSHPPEAAQPAVRPEGTSAPQTAAVASGLGGADQGLAYQQARPAAPAATAQPTAEVSEVHELCALAGRGDLAAGFIAKATPVAQVRRALLEARAAEDEATAIRSQVRPAMVEPAQPAIDTAAIYAARNQHCR